MVTGLHPNGNHPILLRGLSLHAPEDPRPTLVQRSDVKFLDGLLADLSEGGTFRKLANRTINHQAALDPVRFYQPVHRTYQFAIFEAVCDLFPELGRDGQPQLDRNQIESAGLVIRRVNGNNSPPEAWLTDENTLRGWFPLNVGDLDEDMDPDPARRPRRLGTGVPELDEQLGLDVRPAETLFEAVEPLHVAPPDVCAGAGKTLLFGMIPTVSLEHSEAAAEQAPRLDLDTLRDLFPDYLTPAGSPQHVPLKLNPLDVDLYQVGQRQQNNGDRFLSLLRWIIELDALQHPAALDVLNTVTTRLSLDPDLTWLDSDGPFERITEHNDFGTVIADYIEVRLGDLVEHAAISLRDSDRDPTGDDQQTTASGHFVVWRIPDDGTGDDVLHALADRMQSRASEFKIVSGERRFNPRGGRYVARAFIRVQREPDCPPELWWSDYSEAFRIAPHWEHNPDVPPAMIPLPDVPTRDMLKSMKPNVAFEVPESLQNFLNANGASDFLEEKAEKGSGGGLGIIWICSFNIYIIMMIAFIILIIFAILLNIVFNWLLFIRICLPFPAPSEE